MDRIFEEITAGLDAPHKREPQRLLGLIRLLGELYNYSVVSAPIIYELMYTIINYGHRIDKSSDAAAAGGAEAPGAAATSASAQLPCTVAQSLHKFDPRKSSDIDPPADCFRAQMICEALNTCGAYYVRGQAKERLTRFLVYFQRYLLTKPLLPTHIEYAVLDMLDNLEELARTAAAAAIVKVKQNAAQNSAKGAALSPAVLATIAATAMTEVIAAGPQFARYDTMETVQAAIEALETKPEESRQDDGDDDQDDDGDDEEEDAGEDDGDDLRARHGDYPEGEEDVEQLGEGVDEAEALERDLRAEEVRCVYFIDCCHRYTVALTELAICVTCRA